MKIYSKILLVMKLTTLLLIVTLLQVSAKGYSQITLKEKNASLEKVIASIKKQSGYLFIYDKKQIKPGPITVDLKNATIDETLQACFKNQPVTYQLVDKNIILQPKEVSVLDKVVSLITAVDVRGKVIDSLGRPLEGATVTIKGSQQAYITDKNGEFFIAKIPDTGLTLVVTYIGTMPFEIFVDGNTASPLVINLKADVSKLEEVVVVNTGYQTLPKERATGSFTVIDKKRYNEVVGTDVLSRLPYMTSGLTSMASNINIGNQENGIVIRGLSTITASIAKPLIILDNFEFNGDIKNINPNDVENITILKDAAAGSIWGAKAGNGVIVITTKKGKYNQNTTVNFNSNVSIINKPDLYQYKTLSPSEFVDLEKQLFENGYRVDLEPYSNLNSFSPVYEILFKQKSGTLTEAQTEAQLNLLKKHDVRDDYTKYLTKVGVNQQYNLSLSGGSNNLAWNLSGGVDKNSNQDYSTLNRYSFRLNSRAKVSSKLTLSTNINYTSQDNSISRSPQYGEIHSSNGKQIPTYTQIADANGMPLPIYNRSREGYIDTLGGGKLLDWRYFPLTDYKNRKNTQNSQYINAAVDLNYQFSDPLSLSLSYRIEKSENRQNDLNTIGSYFTRDLINDFTNLNNGNIIYRIPKGGILDLTSSNLKGQELRGQINYNKNWTQSSLSGIIGTSISEKVETFNIYRTYGYNENNLTSVPVDYVNRFPSLLAGYGNNLIPNIADFGRTNIRFLSFFSNVAYTIKDRYIISGSARTDASNTFGLETNDKFKPHYSIGGSWNISKEPFYKSSIVSDLRIRATYGKQGNVDPSKTALTTLRYAGLEYLTQNPQSNVINYANPFLRWERVAMSNIGIDFGIVGNRITGSIEYYHKKITDMYSAMSIDPTIGRGPSAVANVGGFQSDGIDIQLNTLNINKKLRWMSDFIINYNTDKMGKVYFPESTTSEYLGGKSTNLPNYSVYSYFVLKSAGLSHETGDPQGYLNGKISANYDSLLNYTPISDLKYIGRMIPAISGSIGNNVSWKNFNIAARITYKFSYYFRRQSVNYSGLISDYQGHSDYSKRWQKPGDENTTTVPSFIYPGDALRDSFYQFSDALVTKGDHIRLQYINLTYQFKNPGLLNGAFKMLEIYTGMNDIGIIWRANKENIDPDNPYGISRPKTIFFGIKGTL